MSVLVGRVSERERLERLVRGAARGHGGALALIGEPGIGKTALIEHVRGDADDDVGVVSATGAEAEADLPFAGLHSLLYPLLDSVGRLPPVQARALEGALAIGPPTSADRLVVHAAALGLLSAAAQARPVLAVVDDAHWLDDASADALRFAARRLDGEPVALLLALRPVEGRSEFLGVERLPVDGLRRADSAELLRRAAGRQLAPAVVDRLHDATSGNPLALLEAPAQLPEEQLTGRDPLGDPLAVGPGVQAGFRRRLDRLPARTRTALLLLAAAGTERGERVAAAASELGVSLDDLGPAEIDQLVVRDGDGTRFRHPLVRAAAYRGALVPDRRAVHRAMAANTTGARRASHLWAAAIGPDPVAVEALEAAAADARARSGLAAAALAMERAARLSPAGDDRAGRLAAAAQDRLVGGDVARAVELAHEAIPQTSSPALAAELNALVGSIGMLAGSLDEGFRMCSAAAEQISAEDPGRAAWMLSTAGLTCFMAGRIPLAVSTTTRAYELASRAGVDDERIAGLLFAGARLISGQDDGGGEHELLDRWPEAVDERALVPGAPHVIGLLQFLGWVERFEEADAFAARVEALAADRGAVGTLPLLRAGQLDNDIRRGHWATARARAGEALRLGTETGQIVQRSLPLALLARLEAAMGLEEECRASVRELLAFAIPAGLHSMNVYGAAALGLLELGLGRPAAAAAHLDKAARLCAEYGQRDPSVVQHLPDRIEALIRAGERERAEAALAEFEAMAERTRRSWPLATVARCHGMLADDFDPCFERAYRLHGPSASPFERGRTELCHGERLLSAQRAREARERLRSALAAFEALGAAPWAARARAELGAAGGRSAPTRDAPARGLTPQELEIALAVARGATNREVASALYMSPKTVEMHLTRVYRKLGVRSRTELAAAMLRAHE